MNQRSPRRTPSIEQLFVATFGLLGLRLGLRPIGDNSFFTHLRTGADLVRGRGIPRVDVYSFSAAGEPWVVQSWLASAVYGAVEATAGGSGLVLLHGALFAGLAVAIASLAAAGTALRTAGAALVALAIGLPYWSPRPLAFGLLAMAAVVALVERRGPMWLLVPVGWFWVNTHGSFVLGLVFVVTAGLCWREGRARAIPWLTGGVLLGALNPLGPRLLAFPFLLADSRQNLARVVEWQPPFDPVNTMVWVALAATLGAVAILIVGCARGRLRMVELVPPLLFLGLGLVAQRNLAPAAIVVAPALARAVRARAVAPAASPPPALETADARRRWFAVVVLGAAAMAFVAASAVAPPYDLDGYPPASVLRAADGRERIVSTDVAGGIRILRDGREAEVFIDDRYDMYPTQVVDDYIRLLDGDPASLRILERYEADAVIWPEREELAATLDRSRAWRRVEEGGGWVAFLRAGGG